MPACGAMEASAFGEKCIVLPRRRDTQPPNGPAMVGGSGNSSVALEIGYGYGNSDDEVE